MGKSVIKRLLVIGDDHVHLAAEYSADTKVEPYVKFRFADREKLRDKQLKTIEAILTSPTIKLTESQSEVYRNLYLDTQDMDAEEFYESMTIDMDVDEKTGDAYTTENPNAKYRYQKCYDARLKQTEEESDFSNPFVLKDGSKAYSARKSDIDWPKNHMVNSDIYRAAWEICVDGREPESDIERTIKEKMGNRHQYFANFTDADDYIRHSCSFWTDAIIAEDGNYYELNYKTSDRKWISEYYDRFIAPLPETALLTLYEVRSLNV